MNAELILQKKREIEDRYGKWTTHNLCLTEDIYTFQPEHGPNKRLRRIMQSISDIANEPLKNLRVLDLACLEGLFAIECALQGAKVMAIEGREANLEKARFAKDVFSLDNVELVLDDVRNLDKEKHGYFDVVLCLGILYHLNTPDVFHFLERIAEVCQRFAIIDTHVSLAPRQSCTWKGKTYWGEHWQEYSADSSSEEVDKLLWAALNNPTSFQFTRSSLYNVLRHVGFTSVYECHIPFGKLIADRVTLVAFKGQRQALVSWPVNEGEEDWPEKPEEHMVFINSTPAPGYTPEPKAADGPLQLLPRRVKAKLKKMLGYGRTD